MNSTCNNIQTLHALKALQNFTISHALMHKAE